MSEQLSPAAQSILDAYGAFEPANVDAMAAALRAVASQLVFNDTLAGAVINPRELLDIANELGPNRENV